MISYRKQLGWALIELLLVLVCVLSLTAVTVYSLAEAVNKQRNLQQAVSDVSELVQAAHSWRLAQPYAEYSTDAAPQYNSGYKCISLRHSSTNPQVDCGENKFNHDIDLTSLGFISNSWDAQTDFAIQSINYPKDSDNRACNNNSCFKIIYQSNVVSACNLAAHFRNDTHYINIAPSEDQCKKNSQRNVKFSVTYV